MLNVTLTKLIFKYFTEGGHAGGGGDGGGGGIKHTFPMYDIPMKPMFLVCKKVFSVADICIVYNEMNY